jgi:hypothetical protein
MTHKPTDETRKTVSAMCAYGVPQENIASVIGCNHETLRKYYREELDVSTAKANSKIAEKLYQKAMQGDTACMIFWLKTRARWAETVKQEHSGPDGGPVQQLTEIRINLVEPKNDGS